MKISKLFHWLYALLMLMPVFFIGFTCCYVVFNDNAFESYYGETINQQEIKNVDSFNVNTIYTLNYNSNTLISQNATLYLDTITFYAVPNNNVTTMNNNASSITALYFFQANNIQYCVFRDIDNNSVGSNIPLNNSLLNFDYKWINSSTSNNVNDWLKNNSTYVEYNRFSYLDDVFEYSLDKLEVSPYFSWAYDSFLVSPFRYIGNLFSVPSNSLIYLFLSYWLDISIIYLVFDMVMYVPLLVHRWLDKGVLE